MLALPWPALNSSGYFLRANRVRVSGVVVSTHYLGWLRNLTCIHLLDDILAELRAGEIFIPAHITQIGIRWSAGRISAMLKAMRSHAKKGQKNGTERSPSLPGVSNMIGSPWPGHLLKSIRKSSGLTISSTKEDHRW
jgi:hypothetical protein